MMIGRTTGTSIAATILALILYTTAFAKEPVVTVLSGDAEMNAAIMKAKSTLPEFWKKLEKHSANEERFSVKVAMPYTDKDVEHMWVTDVRRTGGKIQGTLNNEPKSVKYVRFGQRVEFEEDQISDWTYRRDGKIVGNYTMRPLLSRLPQAEADRYRALLAEP